MARSNRVTRRQAAEDEQASRVAANIPVVEEPTGLERGGNNVPTAHEEAAAGVGTTASVGLNAVLGLLAQVLERLPATAPVASVPSPTNVASVRNVAADAETVAAPSYLTMMEHMQRLGTKFFSGGSTLIEADEWRIRLERNFNSTRCPAEYKKDIAVHYLEGEAHDWWQSVSGRMDNPNCSWETFHKEFQMKYFPMEAYDKLETAFLELRQDSKTVREYESEFNRLKKYTGHELEDETAQVRRFMRGLRVEIRNGCLVRNYSSVAELVEKAAMLESGLEEESRVYSGKKLTASESQTQSGERSGQKRKRWEKNSSGKTFQPAIAGRPPKTQVSSGACFRCGNMGHKARDCPQEDKREGKTGSGPRTCYNCGEVGHIRPNCPKLMHSGSKRVSDGTPPSPNKQGSAPRVYTMIAGPSDPSTSGPITGKSYHLP